MNMKKWIVWKDGEKWTVSPPIGLDREEYEASWSSFKVAWTYVDNAIRILAQDEK